MSFNAQIRPKDIRGIHAWQDTTGRPDYYVTLNVFGGDSVTFTNDHDDTLHGVRATLLAMLAAVDTIDPAEGNQPTADIPWPPVEAAEGAVA